jgi:hypothetical protein
LRASVKVCSGGGGSDGSSIGRHRHGGDIKTSSVNDAVHLRRLGARIGLFRGTDRSGQGAHCPGACQAGRSEDEQALCRAIKGSAEMIDRELLAWRRGAEPARPKLTVMTLDRHSGGEAQL